MHNEHVRSPIPIHSIPELHDLINAMQIPRSHSKSHHITQNTLALSALTDTSYPEYPFDALPKTASMATLLPANAFLQWSTLRWPLPVILPPLH